jgi:hypothetical protein
MCIMNAEIKRRSDSRIFFERESLNLELWLERYEDLKLHRLFCELFWG